MIYLAGKRNNIATSMTAKLVGLQEAKINNKLETFDLFNWWRVNELRFPILATLTKRILAAPVTSIASESAFSMGGREPRDFRSRLKSGTLEALIFGQDWIYSNVGLYDYDAEEDSSASDLFFLISSFLFLTGLWPSDFADKPEKQKTYFVIFLTGRP